MKSKYKVLIGVAVALAIAALLLCGLLFYWQTSTITKPDPTTDEQIVTATDDGFVSVNWDYWQEINPDIIGWITIPGTTINNPIVQAHESDPDYYLSHDVYGNYNPYGAIYLDADCEELGLASPNAVIMGHHFRSNLNSAPFGIIAEYSDISFAQEHATVLVQTPDSQMTYKVRFAEVVNGAEPTKHTSFASDEDFLAWYEASLENAAMILDDQSRPNQVISLATCSYNIWYNNERTVVTTSIDADSS